MSISHKSLKIYNSLSSKKEDFNTINPLKVGMYVCGPTVYNKVHLGNCRTFISFDLIVRFLKHIGYDVRYVRNITDVGHLEESEEDKIQKRAKIEKIEPMEVVQKYTNNFRDVLNKFNLTPPNIEPTATGHILEQIEMIEMIIENGFAYEKNGSEKTIGTFHVLVTNLPTEIMNLLNDIHKEGSAIFMATHDYNTINKYPKPTLRIENNRLFQLKSKSII